MNTLLGIVASCIAGGALSVAAAAVFALRAHAAHIPMLISYAVGALLGAAFLEILPHAFDAVHDPKTIGATVLAGLLGFFVLEKLVLWRHQHAPQWGETARKSDVGEHAHDQGRSGLMVLIGDFFHNFVDGMLVAAAFLTDAQLGLVTALAIIAHEVPQEVGDFLVLLNSGYSRSRALAFNLLSSLGMLAGGILGYLALGALQPWVPSLLGLVAASMIYVAVADLIPGLHRRPELRATLEQVALIGLGVLSIWLVRVFTGHTH